MAYTYEYPRPAVTVDCVLFSKDQDQLKVLLIQRKHDPDKGKWAFPGGFLDMQETLEQAAARELEEETGVKGVELEQFHAFSALDRDPRGRTISVAFMAVINVNDHKVDAADDASDAAWFDVEQLPALAFDHDHVIAVALQKLKKDKK